MHGGCEQGPLALGAGLCGRGSWQSGLAPHSISVSNPDVLWWSRGNRASTGGFQGLSPPRRVPEDGAAIPVAS